MATYLVLNVVFLALILAGLKLTGILHWSKTSGLVLILLLILTAIFDSLIILAGIVEYDPARILGLTIGAAPIEDFFYALAVVIIIPSLWRWRGEKT